MAWYDDLDDDPLTGRTTSPTRPYRYVAHGQVPIPIEVEYPWADEPIPRRWHRCQPLMVEKRVRDHGQWATVRRPVIITEPRAHVGQLNRTFQFCLCGSSRQIDELGQPLAVRDPAGQRLGDWHNKNLRRSDDQFEQSVTIWIIAGLFVVTVLLVILAGVAA